MAVGSGVGVGVGTGVAVGGGVAVGTGVGTGVAAGTGVGVAPEQANRTTSIKKGVNNHSFDIGTTPRSRFETFGQDQQAASLQIVSQRAGVLTRETQAGFRYFQPSSRSKLAVFPRRGSGGEGEVKRYSCSGRSRNCPSRNRILASAASRTARASARNSSSVRAFPGRR